MAETGTVKYPTMQAAFEAAKVEHSKVEEAPAAPEKPAEPVKDDTGTADSTPPKEKDQEAAPAQETSADDLLSEEEYDKLKGDPKALRKALNKAFTTKTQKISAERKAMEDERRSIAEHKQLIEAFQRNPEATIRILADQYKVPLEKTRAEATVETVTNTAVDQLKEALGPDGEILAERLAPVIESIAKSIADQYVKQEIAPLKKVQEEQTQASIAAEVNSDLATFEKKHPNWKTHEAAMTALGRKFQPSAEMGTVEYLESLYKLVTHDTDEAETTKRVVERINQSGRAAEKPNDVNAQIVAPGPPKRPTFAQAFEAAKAGTRWER